MAAAYYRLAPMTVAQQFREKRMGTITHISGNRSIDITSDRFSRVNVVDYEPRQPRMKTNNASTNVSVELERQRNRLNDITLPQGSVMQLLAELADRLEADARRAAEEGEANAVLVRNLCHYVVVLRDRYC